jgi:hypothetical protein
MKLTDEEKLAMLEVQHEPEEGENIHIVFARVPGSTLPIMMGAFTDDQHLQANALARTGDKFVCSVKANRVYDGGVNNESADVKS